MFGSQVIRFFCFAHFEVLGIKKFYEENRAYLESVFIYSLNPRDAYIKLTFTLLQKSCSNMLCNNVLVSALNTVPDNKAQAKKKIPRLQLTKWFAPS